MAEMRYNIEDTNDFPSTSKQYCLQNKVEHSELKYKEQIKGVNDPPLAKISKRTRWLQEDKTSIKIF